MREFICNRDDPEFLEELAELERTLVGYGYFVANSSRSVIPPHQLGGAERRPRLLVIGRHCAFFDGPGFVPTLSDPPEPVVPADLFDSVENQSEELLWTGQWKPVANKEVLSRGLVSRSGGPLVVGTIAGGGLGRRTFSDR